MYGHELNIFEDFHLCVCALSSRFLVVVPATVGVVVHMFLVATSCDNKKRTTTVKNHLVKSAKREREGERESVKNKHRTKHKRGPNETMHTFEEKKNNNNDTPLLLQDNMI